VSRLRMFLRMTARSTLVRGRRGRLLTALVAIATAAAVATAILNLSRDVQAKVRGELRGYGANVVLTAPEGKPLPANSLGLVESALKGRGVAVPFAYVVARTRDDSPVVVVGTDIERVRKLNPSWQIDQRTSKPNGAVIGVRAVALLSLDAQPFTVNFNGQTLQLNLVGTVRTGGPEDSRIYQPLSDFIAWTGVQPSVIEISANLSRGELAAFQRELASIFPAAQVREVRQITEAEAYVFDKTRAALLVSVVLIVLTAGLCVFANLLSSVLDRRKDFAVMKALGASELETNGIFALEASFLGGAGAALGYLIGIGLAAWIGRASLHQAVLPRLDVLPLVLAGSVLLTLLAGVIPLRLLRRIQPAAILKGE
jgi:putative ABC transport system permease protein